MAASFRQFATRFRKIAGYKGEPTGADYRLIEARIVRAGAAAIRRLQALAESGRDPLPEHLRCNRWPNENVGDGPLFAMFDTLSAELSKHAPLHFTKRRDSRRKPLKPRELSMLALVHRDGAGLLTWVRERWRDAAVEYAESCDWLADAAGEPADATATKRKAGRGDGRKVTKETKQEVLVQFIKQQPGRVWKGSLSELREQLKAETGLDVSVTTLSRYLRGTGLIVKDGPRPSRPGARGHRKTAHGTREPTGGQQFDAYTMPDDD